MPLKKKGKPLSDEDFMKMLKMKSSWIDGPKAGLPRCLKRRIGMESAFKKVSLPAINLA